MADKEDRDVRDADELVREYYEGVSTDAKRDDVRDEFRAAQEMPGAEMKTAIQIEGSPDIAPRGGILSGEAGGAQVESGGDIDARSDGGGEEAVGGSQPFPIRMTSRRSARPRA